METEKIILYVIMFGAATIWLIVASKNKSQLGVNLKRVYCPVCKTPQPIIRMPKSITQFLLGGTTCPKCHTNLDKFGNVIT